jgi:hypothetical protein
LYHAAFNLTRASQYTAIIQLKQKGGLVATYYETTDFQSPFNDLPMFNHTTSFYTQVDSQINFEPLEKAFVLKSGRNFPSEFFSIRWTGYILAPYTETFRIYVDAFKTSQFEVIVNGTTIVSNYFNN